MRFLEDPYTFSSNERWTLGVFCVIIGLAIAAGCFPSVNAILPSCPVNESLSLNCPGCGLTRATVRLLKLEPLEALRFNPLVLFLLPYAAFLFTTIVVGVLTGKRIVSQWPRWFVNGFQGSFVLVWLALFAIRVVTWLAPAVNPSGLGLPPEGL